jgi:hypothetical protein
VSDAAEAAARDEAMSAGFDGSVSEAPGLPGIESGLVSDSPHAGTLFPQGHIDGRWFDDVHGVGWRLVTIDAAALDAAVVEWFESIDGAVVSIDAGVQDLVAWFGGHDARWALQRPDFHLFGTAADATGAAALLTELQGQLA